MNLHERIRDQLQQMLGCYEQQLHPVWMNATRRGYEAILNIGCAEGYYAVGLARLMKGARVIARDTNAAAQAAMAELARRFAATHQMWAIRQQPQAVALPEIFESLGHLDQLLAVWEWRSGPTPCLVLQSLSGPLAKVEPALVTPL